MTVLFSPDREPDSLSVAGARALLAARGGGAPGQSVPATRVPA